MKTQIKIFGKSQQVNLDNKLKGDKTFKLQDRISFRGLDIAVENKKGSVRRGVDDGGEEWKTKMFHDYDYIRGTMGVDGDAVDCFVGPNKESDKVFVIHQENPENGKFDEDKVMLGFDSLNYARAAYLAHYDDQAFLGKITIMNFEEFKKKTFATNINLHSKIKDQLVNAGISPNEILIVNGGTVKSSDSRLKASEDFNNGRYKIVIGNYETMGEGLNFNIGSSDVHHLQPAWNSLAIDQGNGRVIRQGNILDSVNTHYYLTKGTIDAFFNQKILDKRGFVNSILMGKDDVMENDEGGVAADEVQIALAEDPEQARKLLQRKNEAFAKLMKERKVKENFSKLDNLFTQKSRLGRMKDKESLAYKSLSEDIDKMKNELNGSSEFEHKNILSEENRPIVLPQHNAVVKVGSVVNVGTTEKAVVSDYSHSTGKITLKLFSQYEIKTRTTDLRTFGNSYNQMIKPAKESAEDMFKKLIIKDKTTNINVIEALPDEVYHRYKSDIMKNFKDGYSHPVIARKKNGTYVGTVTDFAFEQGYDIILPQETPEYFNLVDKAVKANDDDYDKDRSYYASRSNDYAKQAAQRFYGNNWDSKIKYLKQKAKGIATSETDDLEFEEQAVA